jgi:hypothetical protein
LANAADVEVSAIAVLMVIQSGRGSAAAFLKSGLGRHLVERVPKKAI